MITGDSTDSGLDTCIIEMEDSRGLRERHGVFPGTPLPDSRSGLRIADFFLNYKFHRNVSRVARSPRYPPFF
jgi:hypothetical protein